MKLIPRILLDNKAVILVTIRSGYWQNFLEKSLPSLWQLSFKKMSSSEKLLLIKALELYERHSLVKSILLIINFKYEWSFWLLKFLNKLKVHHLEYHPAFLHENCVFSLIILESLLSKIVFTLVFLILQIRVLIVKLFLRNKLKAVELIISD